MAYIGNKRGPRESDLLQLAGHQYFGCSPADLEDDISFAEFSEQRGEVLRVHVDERGKPYLVFSSPNPRQPQRLYLEEHGIELSGEVDTFTDDEKMRWVVRSLVRESE